MLRYNRIHPILTLLRNPSSDFDAEVNEFRFSAGLKSRWVGSEIAVIVELRVLLSEPGAVEGDMPLIDVVTAHEFVVGGLKELPTSDEGMIPLPRALAVKLVGQSYNTLRGWIAAKSMGLEAAEMLLPIADDDVLMQNFAPGAEFVTLEPPPDGSDGTERMAYRVALH